MKAGDFSRQLTREVPLLNQDYKHAGEKKRITAHGKGKNNGQMEECMVGEEVKGRHNTDVGEEIENLMKYKKPS